MGIGRYRLGVVLLIGLVWSVLTLCVGLTGCELGKKKAKNVGEVSSEMGGLVKKQLNQLSPERQKQFLKNFRALSGKQKKELAAGFVKRLDEVSKKQALVKKKQAQTRKLAQLKKRFMNLPPEKRRQKLGKIREKDPGFARRLQQGLTQRKKSQKTAAVKKKSVRKKKAVGKKESVREKEVGVKKKRAQAKKLAQLRKRLKNLPPKKCRKELRKIRKKDPELARRLHQELVRGKKPKKKPVIKKKGITKKKQVFQEKRISEKMLIHLEGRFKNLSPEKRREVIFKVRSKQPQLVRRVQQKDAHWKKEALSSRIFMFAMDHPELVRKIQTHLPAFREGVNVYIKALPPQERKQIEKVINSFKGMLGEHFRNSASGIQTEVFVRKLDKGSPHLSHRVDFVPERCESGKRQKFESSSREGSLVEQWKRWQEKEK